MTDLETTKKLITGIFKKNHEMMEPDDSIFIPLIKKGIEEASRNDRMIYEELLEHALKEYSEIWLKCAREDDDDFEFARESEAARKTFMKYFEGG